jgi:branched-chain amino acid transport system permease protein
MELHPAGLVGEQSRQRLARSSPCLLAAAAIVLILVLPLWVSPYVVGVLTVAYYFGVFAMSWDLLFGYAKEVNFGPTFLIGLGAYGSGMLNSHAGLSVWPCALLGAVIAVLGGALLALPALRLRGPYFGLVTLIAVLLLQQFIIIFADSTGGEIGLAVPGVLSLDATVNYWIAAIFMVASGVIMLAVARSPFGLILQATGKDPTASQALGFSVTKYKLTAFCVSAFFSGMAGALTVFYLGSASLNAVVDMAIAVQIIIAAVLGGRQTIVGGALGAVLLIGAGEYLRPVGELSNFVVATVALVVLLFFPDGLLGYFRKRRVQ